MQDSLTSQPPVEPQAPERFQVEFKGSAMEYFRIWIVNVGLSIVTLGIYSAWAKVRTRRYFYNHTLIGGQSFDYHADPIKILKGRIVLAVFFAIYASARIFPTMWAVVGVLALFAPWFIVRGLIFNLSNSSFRGIRFGFDRDYKASYKMVGRGLGLSLISLGILSLRWPLWFRRFSVPRTRYGQTRFELDAKENRPYDGIFGKAFLMYLGVILVLIVIGGIATVSLKSYFGGHLTDNKEDMAKFGMIIGAGVVIAVYVSLFAVGFWLRAQLMNFFWPRMRLGSLTFESNYTGWDLFLVSLQNGLAILFTLGLAWPWAAVEMARFKAGGLRVVGRPEDFKQFQQGDVATLGATGEEVLDIWDIDLGF